MKIKLISQEQYDFIKNTYLEYPKLTLQNKGYEYINKNELSEDDKNRFSQIEDILKSHIYGFSEFSNLRLIKGGRIQIRFQYDYTYDDDIPTFIGVGYILLDELLNGFESENK